MTSPAASPTFYEKHADTILQAVKANLASDGDVLLAIMREHLRLDPVHGEPLQRQSLNPEMLRLYFQFLRDNERLSLEGQLQLKEIRLIWETLLAFFGEDELEQDRISQVFRLVQRKMEQGQIGQAWIILNIFDYQRSVRVDNERSLFLEEMALIFARRLPASSRLVSPGLRTLLQQASEDLTLLPQALQRLSADLDLRLQLLASDWSEQQRWEACWPAARPAETEQAGQTPDGPRLPEPLRTRKWRLPASFDPATDAHLFADLVSPEAVRIYCDSLIKCVYFLILVTETTGFEEFIGVFFEWLRGKLGPEAMRVFSMFHAQITLEEHTVNEALESLFAEPPLTQLPPQVAGLTAEQLVQATRSLLEECSRADLHLIPPGDYSLGGLILDRALELQPPRFDMSWRIHRLL